MFLISLWRIDGNPPCGQLRVCSMVNLWLHTQWDGVIGHKSGIFPPYTQMESVWANNCRSVFASSTPTSKVTFNCCPEPLGVGIRFITMKIAALGSYNEDTKIPRYLG